MTPMDVYYASIRYLYRGGRQGRLARFLNGLWAKLFGAGIMPNRLAALEVRGRKSGRTIVFPVVIADHAEQRYLVSMLGEQVNWVQNVRAAGGRASLRHGRNDLAAADDVQLALPETGVCSTDFVDQGKGLCTLPAASTSSGSSCGGSPRAKSNSCCG